MMDKITENCWCAFKRVLSDNDLRNPVVISVYCADSCVLMKERKRERDVSFLGPSQFLFSQYFDFYITVTARHRQEV